MARFFELCHWSVLVHQSRKLDVKIAIRAILHIQFVAFPVQAVRLIEVGEGERSRDICTFEQFRMITDL